MSSDSQQQVTIGSESMQIDSTQFTVDKLEDPFKDFGFSIIGNIVRYSSSFEEEETINKDQNKDEGVSVEKATKEVKLTTPASAPIISTNYLLLRHPL